MSLDLYKHLAQKPVKTVIDRLMVIAAIAHPITATPQVYDIYTNKSAAGVSLLTWLCFMLLGLVFLTYGIVHRLKPYILTQILWFVVDALVVVGILLYR